MILHLSSRARTVGVVTAIAVGIVTALGVANAPRLRYEIAMRAIRLPPANAPALCAEPGFAPAGPVLVALGDSLTRGVVAYDYVADVQKTLPSEAMLINAGVNGDRIAHVRARLDSVIACRPSAVLLLIGVNDVVWGPGGEDGLAEYRTDLAAILQVLRSRTAARIAVASVPLIGEDPGSLLNQQGAAFSSAVHEIAQTSGVTYLPLRERGAAMLDGAPPAAPSLNCETPELVSLAVDEGLWMGFSAAHPDWDAIAAARGLTLTTDCLHFTAAGAAPLVELASGFFAEAL